LSVRTLTPNSNFRVPAKPFDPPAGYQLLKGSSREQNTPAFAELDGKQIWHITAPASVDLTQIHELDIGAALRGDPILTTEGNSYGMQPAGGDAEVLLLPYEDPVIYQQRAKVDRAFQLRQVVSSKSSHSGPAPPTLSGATSNNTAAHGLVFTAQNPGQKLIPRKQPEKLSYHFTPLGVKRPKVRDEGAIRLAESILVNAAEGGNEGDMLKAAKVAASPEKKIKEKKKKRQKGTDE
jgi:hypothetical protein